MNYMKGVFKMKKSELQSYDNERLLRAFYWVGVRTTNEVNSKRGLTKATFKEEQMILEEMVKRFNLDLEKLKDAISK